MAWVFDSNSGVYKEVKDQETTRGQTYVDPEKPKSTNTRHTQKSIKNIGSISFLLELMRFLFYVLMGYFIFLNIRPYVSFVEFLWVSGSSKSIFTELYGLPVIGQIFSMISSFFSVVFGSILWAVFQFFEVFPLLIFKSRAALAAIIDFLSSVDFLPVKNSDNVLIKNFKNRYNRLPGEWIALITIIASVAFFLDLLVCLREYPPLNISPDIFFLAGSFKDINFENIISAVITLVAVELIVFLIIWLNNVIRYFKIAAKGESNNGQ